MITFTIPGEARGKGRPRFGRRGKFVQTFTDEKTASFENLVAWTAAQAMAGRRLIEGPALVGLKIHVPVPRSWSKKKTADALEGRVRPTSKPDIDNVVKAVMDALNGVIWKDDSQVTYLAVEKRYSETPRTEVSVESEQY